MKNFRINTNPADVDLTISIMQGMFERAKQETKPIADKILKQKPKCVAMAIWEYQRKNFNYATDPKGIELIRLPSKSIQDRKAGIDCEDFSLMAAGIIAHFGLTPKYRVVDYYGSGWTHIYLVVVCPKTKKEIIIDATDEKFNVESKYLAKKDYKAKEVIKSNGLGQNVWQSNYESLKRQRISLLELKKKYTYKDPQYKNLAQKIGYIETELRMREKNGFYGELPSTSQMLQLRGK